MSVIAHGAGATVGAGWGAGLELDLSIVAVSEAAVRPGPPGPPVSSTFGVIPSATRVKVNFGQTFSVESNDTGMNCHRPGRSLEIDRPTWTSQDSDAAAGIGDGDRC